MLDSKRIKEIMFALGADLCGIASIDRFDNDTERLSSLDALPNLQIGNFFWLQISSRNT